MCYYDDFVRIELIVFFEVSYIVGFGDNFEWVMDVLWLFYESMVSLVMVYDYMVVVCSLEVLKV